MDIQPGRIAQFFFFVGLVLLVVFFASDQSKNPQVGVFCLGSAGVTLGVYLFVRSLKPPETSQRFRLLRRLREKPEDKTQDKPKE